MKRGEIWTLAGGPDYTGKPRPCVILQSDDFPETASITICAFTSDPTEMPVFRIPVEPAPNNGLERKSRLMADKITTVPRTKLGRRIGALAEAELAQINQAALIFLGLLASAGDP